MVPRHFNPTESLSRIANSFIVRGNDDFGERFSFLTLLDYVLNQRLTRDECERFSGEPAGNITGRDHANHVHWLCLTMPRLDCTEEKMQTSAPAFAGAQSVRGAF